MMLIEEPYLHFVQLDSTFTTQDIENYINWAVHSTDHQIMVWTYNVHHTAHLLVQTLTEQSRHMQLSDIQRINTALGATITALHSLSDGRPKIENAYTIRWEDEVDAGDTQLIFNVYDIETLPPITNPKLVTEERNTWENNRTASNFLRLWILFQYGGIFMDSFVDPSDRPLRPFIQCEYGLLFHFHSETPTVITNTIMASTRYNAKLLSLAQHMEKKHLSEYESYPRNMNPVDAPLIPKPAARKQLGLMGRLRNQLASPFLKRKQQARIERAIEDIKIERYTKNGCSKIIADWINRENHALHQAQYVVTQYDEMMKTVNGIRTPNIHSLDNKLYAEYRKYSFEAVTKRRFSMRESFFMDPVDPPRTFFGRRKDVPFRGEEFEII